MSFERDALLLYVGLEAGKRLDAALLQCDEVVGCLILDVVETHLRSSKPREILVLHQEFHSRYKRKLKDDIRKGIIIQLDIGLYLVMLFDRVDITS